MYSKYYLYCINEFTGHKSLRTVLGSNEYQFDELENFDITFWKKPILMSSFAASSKIGHDISKFWKTF